MDIRNDAIKYIKANQKVIINKFADPHIFLPIEHPFTIFMAGSPGAGKTEFSTKFNPALYDYDHMNSVVRIDADEIRKLIPQFNGKNSTVVQPATTIGVEKIFDHIQQHDQNAIVDTTFSDFNKAYDNVKRSLKRHRRVGIFYIHFDPKVAWDYTKIREKKEGRTVTMDFFINAYTNARENVDRIKIEFPQIEVNVIIKELTGNEQNPIGMKTKFNIERVANYLKTFYNKDELAEIIKS